MIKVQEVPYSRPILATQIKTSERLTEENKDEFFESVKKAGIKQAYYYNLYTERDGEFFYNVLYYID